MIIGLTGQTGAGKSTVGKYLSQKGFFVSNCDEKAKEVRNLPEIQNKLCETFGIDVLINGKIQTKLLARKVFSSEENTRKIDDIMHPAILKICLEEMNEALENGCRYAFLDAPVLFESGGEKYCEKVICVVADSQTRLNRIMARDNISKEEALERMGVQKDEEYYISRSDFVIRNLDGFSYKAGIDDIIKLLDSESISK